MQQGKREDDSQSEDNGTGDSLEKVFNIIHSVGDKEERKRRVEEIRVMVGCYLLKKQHSGSSFFHCFKMLLFLNL